MSVGITSENLALNTELEKQELGLPLHVNNCIERGRRSFDWEEIRKQRWSVTN